MACRKGFINYPINLAQFSRKVAGFKEQEQSDGMDDRGGAWNAITPSRKSKTGSENLGNQRLNANAIVGDSTNQQNPATCHDQGQTKSSILSMYSII